MEVVVTAACTPPKVEPPTPCALTPGETMVQTRIQLDGSGGSFTACIIHSVVGTRAWTKIESQYVFVNRIL